MCGAKAASKKAVIEGVVLNVCENCAKLGKVVVEKTYVKSGAKPAPRVPQNEEIVDDYSEILKKKISQSGMKYEDLARSINEHESYVRRVVRGETMPTIALAKKLEKALGVKIIADENDEK